MPATVTFTTRNSSYSFDAYRGGMGLGWTLGVLTCTSGTFEGMVLVDVEILAPLLDVPVVAYSEDRQVLQTTPVTSVTHVAFCVPA